jgi:hypothetical protein
MRSDALCAHRKQPTAMDFDIAARNGVCAAASWIIPRTCHRSGRLINAAVRGLSARTSISRKRPARIFVWVFAFSAAGSCFSDCAAGNGAHVAHSGPCAHDRSSIPASSAGQRRPSDMIGAAGIGRGAHPEELALVVTIFVTGRESKKLLRSLSPSAAICSLPRETSLPWRPGGP